MRRKIITILILLLLVVSVNGKPVTLTEVQEVVYALLGDWNKKLDIKKIEGHYLPTGELGFYIVDLGHGGWVIVSADDVLRPILAFSFENTLTPVKEWKGAAAYLLGLYQKEISIALDDSSLDKDKRWELESAVDLKSVMAPVDPFISVNWNQNEGWNMFCPEDEDGPGGHAYVGCVAVSMAQAMSVYEYPVQARGIKDYVDSDYGSIAVNYNMAAPYEWDQMSASSADEYNAILLYHCAVSVEMDFGADASGAYVVNAMGALKQYFNYSQSMTFEYRYEDTGEWVNTLAAELEAGRPIIYRGNPGDGTAGHAWNLDGYYASGSVDYFHMNFGWSGSQNGYYTLDNINPGSNDFNANQGAILGMAPPASAPYDLTLSETTVQEGLDIGTFVADVIVSDEDPNNLYTFTCKGPYSILLDDYGPASFYIEDEMLYTDEVFNYVDQDPEANSIFLLIEVEDQYGTSYAEDFEITIERSPLCNAADIVISSQITQPLCNGGSDGYIDITVTGNYPGFTYSWSTGETTEDIGNLSAGVYDILVTDSELCTKSEQLIIDEPEQILVTETTYSPLCHGDSNGSIKIIISGGIEPFSIRWDDNSTLDSISGLTEGCYNVNVTDTNGCLEQKNICLTEPEILTLSLAKQDNICYGDSSGTVYTNASGGTPNYQFTWDDQEAEASNGSLPAGQYTITVHDANGCSASDSILLVDPDKSTIDNIIGENNVEEFLTYTYSLEERDNLIYHWIVEAGNVLSGQGSHVVQIQWGSYPSGIIKAYVETDFGCLSDTTLLDVNISGVGVNLEETNRIRIYPNPMNDYTIIEFTSMPPNGSVLSISDISGKIVRRISNIVNNKVVIFKDDLPPGLYIVEIEKSHLYRSKLLIE